MCLAFALLHVCLLDYIEHSQTDEMDDVIDSYNYYHYRRIVQVIMNHQILQANFATDG